MQQSIENLSLVDYLLMPVQHLLQTKQLFGKLKDLTPVEHVDHEHILFSYNAVENICQHIQQKQEKNQNSEEVTRIQHSFRGDCPELASPFRKFVCEGILMIHPPFTIKNALYEKVNLFLFNDAFVLAKPLVSGSKNAASKVKEYKFLEMIPLVRIARVDDLSPNLNIFEICFHQRSEKYVFNCSSVSDKQTWLFSIQSTLQALWHNDNSDRELLKSESFEKTEISKRQALKLGHEQDSTSTTKLSSALSTLETSTSMPMISTGSLSSSSSSLTPLSPSLSTTTTTTSPRYRLSTPNRYALSTLFDTNMNPIEKTNEETSVHRSPSHRRHAQRLSLGNDHSQSNGNSHKSRNSGKNNNTGSLRKEKTHGDQRKPTTKESLNVQVKSVENLEESGYF